MCRLTPGCPPILSLPCVPPKPPSPGAMPTEGEQQGRRAVPDNAVPADAEQIGFPMVISRCRAETLTSLFQGEQGRARHRGWGRSREPGRTPWGAGSTLGVLRGARTLQGPPPVGGYPQVPPSMEQNCKSSAETLLSLLTQQWDTEVPPRSPREPSPVVPPHPVQGGP